MTAQVDGSYLDFATSLASAPIWPPWAGMSARPFPASGASAPIWWSPAAPSWRRFAALASGAPQGRRSGRARGHPSSACSPPRPAARGIEMNLPPARSGGRGRGGATNPVAGPRPQRPKLTQRVRTTAGAANSSILWLERQLNDPYVAEAKRLGYRSRAAFQAHPARRSLRGFFSPARG